MIKITIVALCLLPGLAFAGGEAVQQWWDGEYKQSIEPQQVEEVNRMADERCKRKLERMEELTTQYPDDYYFQKRYEYWQERCGF